MDVIHTVLEIVLTAAVLGVIGLYLSGFSMSFMNLLVEFWRERRTWWEAMLLMFFTTVAILALFSSFAAFGPIF